MNIMYCTVQSEKKGKLYNSPIFFSHLPGGGEGGYDAVTPKIVTHHDFLFLLPLLSRLITNLLLREEDGRGEGPCNIDPLGEEEKKRREEEEEEGWGGATAINLERQQQRCTKGEEEEEEDFLLLATPMPRRDALGALLPQPPPLSRAHSKNKIRQFHCCF